MWILAFEVTVSHFSTLSPPYCAMTQLISYTYKKFKSDMTVPYIKFTTCEKIQLDTHFKKVKMASVLLLFEVLPNRLASNSSVSSTVVLSDQNC